MKTIVSLLALGLLGSVAPAAEPAVPKNMMLFLLIGQSNMAGRGPVEAQDQVPHPRVFMLNKKYAWVPAVDPVHFDKPALAGVGLGSTFGRVIAEEHPDAVVGLIPAAFGGTSLAEWRTDGPLYMNAIDRAREAMAQGRLAGILWHQGENDATDHTAGTYVARFAKMIAQLRKDLGAEDVPVIVGELGRFFANNGEINAVLAEVPQQVPHSAVVSSEGLTDRGDQIHFDSRSYREFGRRYAAAWAGLAGK
jgi:hypothetical protein